MRTQDEIVARIHELRDQELFGFGRGVLLGYLDFEHAKIFQGEFKDIAPEGWDAEHPESDRTDAHVIARAHDYNDFAWDKVSDHRSNSAMRNIDKMRAWAWLLGKDDVIAAAEEVSYAPYGAPQLRVLCEGLGFSVPNDPGLHRMADGQPCRPDCDWGCR